MHWFCSSTKGVIFCPEELESKASLQPTNWTKRSVVSFKGRETWLCVLLVWGIFHFDFCVEFTLLVTNWENISLNLNNLACEGLERFFINQKWWRSRCVNVATNVPFSALCSSVQPHSSQPVKNLVLLLRVFGLAGMD